MMHTHTHTEVSSSCLSHNNDNKHQEKQQWQPQPQIKKLIITWNQGNRLWQAPQEHGRETFIIYKQRKKLCTDTRSSSAHHKATLNWIITCIDQRHHFLFIYFFLWPNSFSFTYLYSSQPLSDSKKHISIIKTYHITCISRPW